MVGDPFGCYAESERGFNRFGAEQVDRCGDAVGGQRPYPVRQTGAVGDRLGPQLAQKRERALRGGPDHRRAGQSGQLHGEHAHTAGRPADQNRVLRPQIDRRQCGRSGGTSNAQRARDVVAETVRGVE